VEYTYVVKRAVALAAVLAGCIGAGGSVDRVPNVAYAADDLDAHRLDLYLPPNRASVPIVVFVHGGSFLQGDRGDYALVGEQFARQGLATAVVSYRNFPQADADGATADVAMAVAWVLRHASDYGLSAKNVFLAGHSAGGQIVALLGVDAAYLERDGSSPSALRGVVAVAGAYDVRDLSDESEEYQKIDAHIFGATPAQRGTVSPSLFVRAGAPPTIAVCGTEDDPQACERATVYVHKLVAAGGSAYVIRVVGATHMGTLRSLIDSNDPLNAAFHDFINQHSAP
jgi:acetyl esterase/lipase